MAPAAARGGGTEPGAAPARDLDTIVMTALRKEPERRYESAAALSEDLGRHLSGRAVLAQPGTLRYRTGKFLGRHRVGALVTVLLAVSAGMGIGATLYEARRAERHFQQVRALANTFVFDVHDRIERLPGSTEARQAIVRTALTYLEGLRNDAGGDATLARELAQGYVRSPTSRATRCRRISRHGGSAGQPCARRGLLAPSRTRRSGGAPRTEAIGYQVGTIRQAGGDLTAATDAFSTATDSAKAWSRRLGRSRVGLGARRNLFGAGAAPPIPAATLPARRAMPSARGARAAAGRARSRQHRTIIRALDRTQRHRRGALAGGDV